MRRVNKRKNNLTNFIQKKNGALLELEIGTPVQIIILTSQIIILILAFHMLANFPKTSELYFILKMNHSYVLNL